MGAVEWAAIGVILAAMLGLGGAVVRLMDRLNKAEAIAASAGTSASDAKLRVDLLENQLVEHRVAVATEYVSRKTLETMEGKMVEAINRLGDRLDKLFNQRAAPPA